MTPLKILTLVCATFVFAEAKWVHHQKREAKSNICDPVYNNTNKIQCYCIKSSQDPLIVKSADCYPTVNGIFPDDPCWDSFNALKDTSKLILTNTRGIPLRFIPTKAFKHAKALLKLDVKYGNIEFVGAFAFANLTLVEEILLRDNQIKTLRANAFANHPDLKTINLDTNNIVEVNRDVFKDLPAIEKLYLTNNKITTIHDRAFVHLANLKELEIDRNNIFSLNSESFSGLKNLDKLDLSSNSLEVIGDNTFSPLIRLRSLNLDGNKIQMIDERGFHGLANLQALSLAQNALTDIDNVKVFEGLNSLTSLSLKANKLRGLKKEVMAPLLNVLNGNMSNLDIEENNFPCDCRLDWFMTLMNQTQSSRLKLALENLKCYPDAELRERYNNSAPMYEDEGQEQAQNAEYELYDDTQLDGKLFYSDLRFLLNCSGDAPQNPAKVFTTTVKPKTTKLTSVHTTTKAASSLNEITPKPFQVNKAGLLDLSKEETANTEAPNKVTENKIVPQNQERRDRKLDSFTTSRLATVSAKPVGSKYDEHDMASDEAKPDRIKAHRSIQDEIKDPSFTSDANKNIGCVTMLFAIVLLSFS